MRIEAKSSEKAQRSLNFAGSAFLPSLASLRFFAALYVACWHVSLVWQNFSFFAAFSRAGWIGVSFFFILSGFVLMWNFNIDGNKKDFICRRIARIYPLHWLCLFIVIALYLATGKGMSGYHGNYIETFANFLLVHDWVLIGNIAQTWNGVSWTLSCEWFFYLVAVFLFMRMLKARHELHWILISLWILLVMLNIISLTQGWAGMSKFMHMHPVFRLFEFTVGAYGAMLVKNGFKFRNRFFALTLSTVPIALYCLLGSRPYGNFLISAVMPGFLLLIISFANLDISAQKLWTHSTRLVLLGESSYSFYMLHAIILGVTNSFILRRIL
ncbi:MAG: acyltransferase, partial [Deltaproteobacteria bacterium]|nr:acyltransferase [Deltaproteobacteria bacterium]